MTLVVLPLIGEKVDILAPNGSLDDRSYLVTGWYLIIRILILGNLCCCQIEPIE